MGVFIIGLQYRIWVGEGSFGQVSILQQQIDVQKSENNLLSDRNSELMAEVIDLKNGLQAVEEHARNQLGMISNNETFFWVVSD